MEIEGAVGLEEDALLVLSAHHGVGTGVDQCDHGTGEQIVDSHVGACADALGELIVGIVLVFITIPSMKIEWSLIKILLSIIVIPFSTLIYTGIKIATTAIAFWTKRSGSITYMFYMANEFAKYPVSIYNNVIRSIITFIIPFAFTAYYPANYIITSEAPVFNIGMTILMSILLMILGSIIWQKGIKAYESAGS